MAELKKSGTVTLASVAGTVTGTVTLGPGANGDRGPATWHITGVVVKTSRPGVAPIPRVEVYKVSALGRDLEGIDYDGSFNQGAADINLTRGQTLIAVWTGGTVGDVATLVVSGTKQ